MRRIVIDNNRIDQYRLQAEANYEALRAKAKEIKTDANRHYDVEPDIRNALFRSILSKGMQQGTSTDEEINNMLSKAQKRNALRKRMIAAGVMVATDLVILGSIYARYRRI